MQRVKIRTLSDHQWILIYSKKWCSNLRLRFFREILSIKFDYKKANVVSWCIELAFKIYTENTIYLHLKLKKKIFLLWCLARKREAPSTAFASHFLRATVSHNLYFHHFLSVFVCVHVSSEPCTSFPWTLFQDVCAVTKSSHSCPAIPPFIHYQSAACYLTYFSPSCSAIFKP